MTSKSHNEPNTKANPDLSSNLINSLTSLKKMPKILSGYLL